MSSIAGRESSGASVPNCDSRLNPLLPLPFQSNQLNASSVSKTLAPVAVTVSRKERFSNLPAAYGYRGNSYAVDSPIQPQGQRNHLGQDRGGARVI